MRKPALAFSCVAPISSGRLPDETGQWPVPPHRKGCASCDCRALLWKSIEEEAGTSSQRSEMGVVVGFDPIGKIHRPTSLSFVRGRLQYGRFVEQQY